MSVDPASWVLISVGRRGGRRVSCGDAGFHCPGLAAPSLGSIGRVPAGQGMARTRLTASANSCARARFRVCGGSAGGRGGRRRAAAGSAAWQARPWRAGRRAAAAASSTANQQIKTLQLHRATKREPSPVPRPTKRGALVPDVLLPQAMRSASAQPFDSVPLEGAGPLVWSCDSWCPSKVGYRL